MKKALRQYLESQIDFVRKSLDGEDDLGQRNNICWYALQRGLGATDLAKQSGVDCDIADMLLTIYHEKLKEMERAV